MLTSIPVDIAVDHLRGRGVSVRDALESSGIPKPGLRASGAIVQRLSDKGDRRSTEHTGQRFLAGVQNTTQSLSRKKGF